MTNINFNYMISGDKFKIIRGDTENIIVTFKDSDGVAINLTNKVVFFTVKEVDAIDEIYDTNAKISKKITVHSNPTAGETTIALTSEDTNLTPKDYLYDLQIVGNGVVSTLSNLIEVVQDITKRVS